MFGAQATCVEEKERQKITKIIFIRILIEKNIENSTNEYRSIVSIKQEKRMYRKIVEVTIQVNYQH